MYTFNFKYVDRNVKFKMSSAEIVILPLHYNALDHVQKSCIHLKHTTKSGNQKKRRITLNSCWCLRTPDILPKAGGVFKTSQPKPPKIRRHFQKMPPPLGSL